MLKDVRFEVLRREDRLESAQLTGLLTAVLRVPDLRVGDELEVALTVSEADPTLGTQHAGLLAMAPAPAPGRYRLGMSWPAGAGPALRASADMAGAMVERPDGVDIRLDNPAFLSPPKDAPPRYGWRRVLQYSSFSDWPSISRHFAPLYAAAAVRAADSPIRREAARIAAAHDTPMARAAAALKLVQQNVRYIYVGLDGGNLQPATAEETWQRRFGDCKGKSALLLALLSELGIAAEPVLINAGGEDDGLDERLPSPQLFDHVLVRARIDGAAYWLDATLPPVVPPRADLVYPAGWVLPVTAGGAALERIAWAPAAVPDELHLFEIDARAGFDQPGRITTTAILRGVKALQQQVRFAAVTRAQMLEAFRRELAGSTWQAIDDVQWRYDEKAAASILTISGTGLTDWDRDGNGARSLALPGGGFSPPDRHVRPAGQDGQLPFYNKPEYVCHVTTVRLPADTKAVNWSSKPAYDMAMFGRTYHRAFELRDGAIRMIRGSRIVDREVDVAAALRDNRRIAAFDNSMGWIFYDPARTRTFVGDGGRVPATYEIDWTAADVPCTTRTVAPAD
ncbi:MAG: transglutaminase [Sphingomonas fennica]